MMKFTIVCQQTLQCVDTQATANCFSETQTENTSVSCSFCDLGRLSKCLTLKFSFKPRHRYDVFWHHCDVFWQSVIIWIKLYMETIDLVMTHRINLSRESNK